MWLTILVRAHDPLTSIDFVPMIGRHRNTSLEWARFLSLHRSRVAQAFALPI